jgi:RND family efflux transporter MFP subunit
MKVLPILATAAAVLATVSIVRTQPRPAKAEPPSPPPVAPYSETVAATGLIEPSTENVSIGTHLPGVVEKVSVVVGQQVKAGEPLFHIDVRHLDAQLAVRRAAAASARATIQTAETQLADERDQLIRSERLAKEKVISPDELARRQFAVRTAEAKLGEARATLTAAEAQVGETETELSRAVVTSPMDAEVLQVKVRAGEFAPAGQMAQPLLVLGRKRPLHLRVDVDEHEAWRVQPMASAVAHVRGNAGLQTRLRFVRFEPMVIPKRSLTGAADERVDTRVLQVVYEVLDDQLPLFVGQQMDAFIEAGSPVLAKAR